MGAGFVRTMNQGSLFAAQEETTGAGGKAVINEVMYTVNRPAVRINNPNCCYRTILMTKRASDGPSEPIFLSVSR